MSYQRWKKFIFSFFISNHRLLFKIQPIIISKRIYFTHINIPILHIFFLGIYTWIIMYDHFSWFVFLSQNTQQCLLNWKVSSIPPHKTIMEISKLLLPFWQGPTSNGETQLCEALSAHPLNWCSSRKQTTNHQGRWHLGPPVWLESTFKPKQICVHQ